GFNGTETDLNQRSVSAGSTILNGAYQSPATVGSTASYTVTYVFVNGQDSSLPSRLDGFAVQNARFGAVSADKGNLTGNQCTVSSLFSVGLLIGQGCSFTLSGSTVSQCTQGAIAVYNSALTVQTSLLVQNTTSLSGAAIKAYSSTVSLDRCTVADNIATY